MAHFGFTAEQALSASIEVEKAEIMKHDIESAIKRGVENGMPFAKAEVLLPKDGGIDMLQGQIAALEADGFKVYIESLIPTWAVLLIVWGNVTTEVSKELDAARSNNASKEFEKAYENTKRQLKNELIAKRKRVWQFFLGENRTTTKAAYETMFDMTNWQAELAIARNQE